MVASRRDAERPPFHPLTVLRRFEGGAAFRWVHALAHILVMGSTGSGKTSAIGRFIALGMLAAFAGGVVLCSKPEEVHLWRMLMRMVGREDDLIVVDDQGGWCFNVLDWEAERAGEGGGLTINIVALL